MTTNGNETMMLLSLVHSTFNQSTRLNRSKDRSFAAGQGTLQEIMTHTSLLHFIALLICGSLMRNVSAFLHPTPKFRSSTVVEGATGGWGIGQSRDMIPEEFARGDRKAFEGYRLTDRGEFMRQLQQDKEGMKIEEMDELLGVARMAGINVKNPDERLNKFEADLLQDEEDLDLSV